jgi:tetratricopeptide (TPR) repeat protein
MKTKFMLFILLYLVLFNLAEAADFSTFDGFYKDHFEVTVKGVAIGLFLTAIVLGITLLTGGTAITPLVATIGQTIGGFMGLSGVAATNAGLALLGGGSIAAGGFGMAGGAIVLSTALDFTGTEVFNYAVLEFKNYYSEQNFIEQSKTMTSLPLPKNKKGSDTYKEAIEKLSEIDEQKTNTDTHTLSKTNEAIEIINKADWNTLDNEYTIQLYTLEALLFMRNNDYTNAKTYADKALSVSNGKPEFSATLPKFIYAVSSVYQKDVDFKELTESYFKPSILEKNNSATPLLFSIYLDRIIYRFNDGEANGNDIDKVFEIAKNMSVPSEQKAAIYSVIIGHYNAGLFTEQQQIASLSRAIDSNLKTPQILHIITSSLENYEILLSKVSKPTSDIRDLKLTDKQKESLKDLQPLLDVQSKYVNDEKRLVSLAEKFIYRLYDAETNGRNLHKVFEETKKVNISPEFKFVMYLDVMNHYISAIQTIHFKISSLSADIETKNSPDTLKIIKSSLTDYQDLLHEIEDVVGTINAFPLNEKQEADLQPLLNLQMKIIDDETKLVALVKNFENNQVLMNVKSVQSETIFNLTLMQWIGLIFFNTIIILAYSFFKRKNKADNA